MKLQQLAAVAESHSLLQALPQFVLAKKIRGLRERASPDWLRGRQPSKRSQGPPQRCTEG